MPTTSAPARAARSATPPVPQATSSTRMPGVERKRFDDAIVNRRESLRNALVARAAPRVGDGSGHAAEHTARHERPLLRRRRPARGRGRAAGAATAAGDARRVRRPGARPRRGLRATARDRGGPRPLLDPLRPARQREDDARADRRRLDRRGLRGAVGGLGDGEGRARGARAGEGAARHNRPAHDPLPRRDPPLQQGAAGRAAAGGGVGTRDADRRDDREPVLRGQLRAHLPRAGVRARVADAGGDDGRRPARARGGRRRRRPTRSSS